MSDKKTDRNDTSAPDKTDTPGLPKESGSREQRHPDQNLDSGNPKLDRESSQRTPHRPDPGTGPTRSGK
jgi:hypothetical protein